MKLYLNFYHIMFLTFIIASNLHAQKLTMEYSTYLGGSSEDRAHNMAVDKQGNIYLTAPIQSTNFPITPNAIKKEPTGIYLAKISSGGDSLIYSTYIGASGGANYAHGVAVDDEGNVYIAGNTTNSNFPTTENAFDRHFHGPANDSHGDAFVMKLNLESNKIIYSTFIGGSGMDICGRITVDAEGNAYIIGSTASTDFPVTAGAYDTTFNGGNNDGRDDIFVAKLDPSGSNLLYCTYIGGSSTELYGNNIIADGLGCVYFTATTSSPDFKVTANAYDTSYNGGSGIRGAGDGFIMKLNSTGTDIEYSTFIGGTGDDFSKWLSLDKQGNIFVCGNADSSGFPLTSNSFGSGIKNGGFIAKFDSQLNSLLYSTFWNISIETMDIHPSGAVIIAGATESINYPVTPDALYSANNGAGDICISIIDPVSNSLIYSTYFGGRNHEVISSLHLENDLLYISGNTISDNFPVSENAYDRDFNGGTTQYGGDAFVTRFFLENLTTTNRKTGFNEPDNFRLYQNYPNPFNPATVISYTIGTSQLSVIGNVKLKIYNLLGQEIKTLIDKFQKPGEYSIKWDARDNNNTIVSSGVYFYTLETEKQILQKKMIMLR